MSMEGRGERESRDAITRDIVHDFNNYLAAIQGFAQLGQMIGTEQASMRYFSEILTAAEKASALVKQIHGLALPEL